MEAEVHTLAERIRTARMRSGLSQTELAKALNVNRSTVGHWEREQGFSPTVEHINTMSDVMSVNVSWLLQGTDDAHRPDVGGARTLLESKMISLSKHLPVSFLTSLVALMENAERYL